MPLSQAKIVQSPTAAQAAPAAPTAADIKQHLEAQVQQLEEESTQAEAAKPNPKDKREYTFDLEYKDDRGKMWNGRFTSQILNVGQKRLVAIMVSRMAAGTSFDSISPLQTETNRAIAHMEYSLIKKPAWAENFDGLDDEGPIYAVWEEVTSHEATFLGRGANQSSGEESS